MFCLLFLIAYYSGLNKIGLYRFIYEHFQSPADEGLRGVALLEGYILVGRAMPLGVDFEVSKAQDNLSVSFFLLACRSRCRSLSYFSSTMFI